MASYEQSKTSRLWSVRFREVHADGTEHHKRLSGFVTKKAAQYGYEEYILKKAREPREEVLPEELPGSMFFDTLVASYMEYESVRVKPSTLYDIKHKFDRQILLRFGGKRISDIKPIDILNYQNELSGKYSYAYVSSLMTALRAVFRYGAKYFGITDITATVDKPRNTEAKKELHVWSIDEYKAFENALDNATYKMFFKMLYFLGLRRGEAEALTWADVDLLVGTVKISKSITRKSDVAPWVITTPKNSSSNRTVFLPESLSKDLQAYRSECVSVFETEFIFGGVRPLACSSVDRAFKAACEQSGVRKIRIHDLRHSCASLLISRGVSVTAVSKLLGHSDTHMTLNVYSHVLQTDNEKMLEEMQRAVSA